jgi:hypothetical protein
MLEKREVYLVDDFEDQAARDRCAGDEQNPTSISRGLWRDDPCLAFRAGLGGFAGRVRISAE